MNLDEITFNQALSKANDNIKNKTDIKTIGISFLFKTM